MFNKPSKLKVHDQINIRYFRNESFKHQFQFQLHSLIKNSLSYEWMFQRSILES